MAGMAAFGLQSRLLAITALVLSTCLGAVAWLLDRSFKSAVRASAQQELQATAHGILSAAQEHDDGLVFAASEPLLQQPDSNRYALVDAAGQGVLWRSPSAVASGIDFAMPLLGRRPAPGESVFAKGRADRFVFAYTVIWEPFNAETTIWVVTEWAPYRRRIATFRRDIAVGLFGTAAFFVLVQFGAVRWGFAPVRRMVARLRALEEGARVDVGADYPRELASLARNINHFVVHERDSRKRYRRAMDDLAHSLKTPLAVLKNASRDGDAIVREQVERMENTVAYQLSRAAAMPPALSTAATAVVPVIARVTRGLQRAYVEKDVAVRAPWQDADAAAANACVVRVEEGDLLELLGNLIENAFKYTRSQVRIAVAETPAGVATVIEDDGHGIPANKRELVLKRGARADAGTDGQGIGLAVVVELANAHGGRLWIDASADLGGAAVELVLPSARRASTGKRPLERRRSRARTPRQ